MGRTQERPVASVEVAEKRALRDDEEQTNNGCNDMACGIEEKELAMISYLWFSSTWLNVPWTR